MMVVMIVCWIIVLLVNWGIDMHKIRHKPRVIFHRMMLTSTRTKRVIMPRVIMLFPWGNGVIIGVKRILGHGIMRGIILLIRGTDLCAIILIPVQFKMLVKFISVKGFLAQYTLNDLHWVVNHLWVVRRLVVHWCVWTVYQLNRLVSRHRWGLGNLFLIWYRLGR